MRFNLLFVLIFFSSVLCLSQQAAQAGFIDYPLVRLQMLDKSTARTVTLEAKVGTTIEYGSTFIRIQACRKSEPLDKPESAAFLQVWEVPIGAEKSEWLFSGWMFASSPALSAMDHAVYDIWVLDCKGKVKQSEAIDIVEAEVSTEDQTEIEASDDTVQSDQSDTLDDIVEEVVSPDTTN